MDSVELCRELAIIIISAEVFGLLSEKLNIPRVAGKIIAGLVIGPSLLNVVQSSDFISVLAELGVIMLMFTAGLDTNMSDLRETGLKALLIACAGVAVPLVCGTLLYMAFYGFGAVGTAQFCQGIFIGTILTATSVSITVQTLKELGKLSTKVGTAIVSAAVIDDVIGIIVLTLVIGTNNAGTSIGTVLLRTALFFVFAFAAGHFLLKLFRFLDRKWPHTHRISVMALAVAFLFAFLAEYVFGVADITGAYAAGVILCQLSDAGYISRKVDVNSYMIFSPVFFVSIGLQTNIRDIDSTVLLFSLAFVGVGLITKVIGCGGMARLLGFSSNDALKIGCGMMTRGEVALIVAQRGMALNVIDQKFFSSVILLIIVSSILTPIILKMLYLNKSFPHRQPSVQS